MKERVPASIVQAIVTIVIVVTVCAMAVIQADIPDWLLAIAGAALGVYFEVPGSSSPD